MELKTKKGESFLIDEEDYNLVKNITWHKSSKGYIRGWCKIRKKRISLHRLVMGIWEKSTPIIDHIDRNPSNNKKDNLRTCTLSENQRNRTPSGKSKYLGVSIYTYMRKYITSSGEIRFYASKKPFRAQIAKDGKYINLGKFDNEIDAAKKYNEFALKYHGEFANLNTFD